MLAAVDAGSILDANRSVSLDLKKINSEDLPNVPVNSTLNPATTVPILVGMLKRPCAWKYRLEIVLNE